MDSQSHVRSAGRIHNAVSMSDSLDPRVNRLDLQKAESAPAFQSGEMWSTYEVFHQEKRGKQHMHVGAVRAPDAEMALVLAKEQYARRLHCVNLWVVKTSDVFAFSYDDEDMFETTPEKLHREAAAYKSREKIEEYKKRKAAS